MAEKLQFWTQFNDNGGQSQINYLKYQMTMGKISEELCTLAVTLQKLAPSSASLERIFSTMGFVQNDLRNRLGMEKLKKTHLCKKGAKLLFFVSNMFKSLKRSKLFSF